MSSLLKRLVALTAALAFATSDALNVKLSGVNYDFRQGPDGYAKRCKGNAKVETEIRRLQTITNRVRIYSLTDCDVSRVLKTARDVNMTVWLGLWVSDKRTVFSSEVAELKSLMKKQLVTSELIEGINIGSEALYRNETTAEDLIKKVGTVRTLLKENNLDIPISITDTLGKLAENPEIVDAVDIVTFNQFPFWNKVPIESAVADMEGSIDSFFNSTKSKPFIITETGWAAAGKDKKASEASPESAARYMKEFYLLAEKRGWKYYYFAGFDTPYRQNVEGNANSVEAFFGIFGENGRLNTHYDELTVPAVKMLDGPTLPLNTTKSVPSPSPTTSSSAGVASTLMWTSTVLLAITTAFAV